MALHATSHLLLLLLTLGLLSNPCKATPPLRTAEAAMPTVRWVTCSMSPGHGGGELGHTLPEAMGINYLLGKLRGHLFQFSLQYINPFDQIENKP